MEKTPQMMLFTIKFLHFQFYNKYFINNINKSLLNIIGKEMEMAKTNGSFLFGTVYNFTYDAFFFKI